MQPTPVKWGRLSCLVASSCLQTVRVSERLADSCKRRPSDSSVGEVLGFHSRLRAFRRRPCRSSTRRPAYRACARSCEPPRQLGAALDPPPPRTTAVVVSSEPSSTLLHQRRAKPGIVVDRPGVRQRSAYRPEGQCRVHARFRAYQSQRSRSTRHRSWSGVPSAPRGRGCVQPKARGVR